MVTINEQKWMGKRDPYGNSVYYREGECLSTDTKPTEGWANGSKLIEMDTSKLFLFDAQNRVWREFT